MTAQHIIDNFEDSVNAMTKEFVEYMFSEPDEDTTEDYYWIAGDMTWTLEINDYYWSLWDIYNILKKQYPRDKVFSWYDYSIYYSSKDNSLWREYYINMDNFMRMYDWKMEIKEFSRIYREKRDKDQFYWNSKEWQEKEKEIIKPVYEHFEKDIQQYIDNNK